MSKGEKIECANFYNFYTHTHTLCEYYIGARAPFIRRKCHGAARVSRNAITQRDILVTEEFDNRLLDTRR